MTFFIVLLLGGLSLLAISLQRTYHLVPERELRRRARKGDRVAELLYRAAAYGASLRALLWLLVIATSVSFFVFVVRATELWFGVTASALLIWIGFIWLPMQDASRLSVWTATKLAPALEAVLRWIHPPFSRVQRFIRSHRPVRLHTGLYEKEDILGILARQEVQMDNRVTKAELEIAQHALTFGDKQISEILTPRRVVKMVSAEETTGPVLMSELHESGFSRFPVYGQEPDNIVGVLFMRDLVKAKSATKVSKIMRDDVYYVHQDQSLYHGLQALLKTHQQLFVVVNSFEEYVGIVTMEDIIEEVVGQQIVDEFDQYEDMRAVAAQAAEADHTERNHPDEVPEAADKTGR